MYLLKALVPCALLISADQVTKWLARIQLFPGELVGLVPNYLYVTHVQNRGALFGAFSGLNQQQWELWLLIVPFSIALIFLILMIKQIRTRPFSALNFALCFSGAASNCMDRLTQGYVVDFIELRFSDYVLPAFNFADIYLIVGATILSIRLALGGRPHLT